MHDLKGMKRGLFRDTYKHRRLKDEVANVFTSNRCAWKHCFVCYAIQKWCSNTDKNDLLKAGLGGQIHHIQADKNLGTFSTQFSLNLKMVAGLYCVGALLAAEGLRCCPVLLILHLIT